MLSQTKHTKENIWDCENVWCRLLPLVTSFQWICKGRENRDICPLSEEVLIRELNHTLCGEMQDLNNKDGANRSI